MTYKQLYPFAALCMLFASGSPIAADSLATVQPQGWTDWLGSKLNFGTVSLGGVLTVDGTKGSSLLTNTLKSCGSWVLENKALTAASLVYICYRLKMNRIIDSKLKELTNKITQATGAALASDYIDDQAKKTIFDLISQIKSEANLSCYGWFVSCRWCPSWVPGLSLMKNVMPSSASNLTYLESIDSVDKVTKDVIEKIHNMFTRQGL